jgi:pimeloyl-ACP methyl ester carboxylesterase
MCTSTSWCRLQHPQRRTHLQCDNTLLQRDNTLPRRTRRPQFVMDALQIKKAIVSGFDLGARTACIIAALWPERCSALVSVGGYLIGSVQAGKTPLPSKAELEWWYQTCSRGRACRQSEGECLRLFEILRSVSQNDRLRNVMTGPGPGRVVAAIARGGEEGQDPITLLA